MPARGYVVLVLVLALALDRRRRRRLLPIPLVATSVRLAVDDAPMCTHPATDIAPPATPPRPR